MWSYRAYYLYDRLQSCSLYLCIASYYYFDALTQILRAPRSTEKSGGRSHFPPTATHQEPMEALPTCQLLPLLTSSFPHPIWSTDSFRPVHVIQFILYHPALQNPNFFKRANWYDDTYSTPQYSLKSLPTHRLLFSIHFPNLVLPYSWLSCTPKGNHKPIYTVPESTKKEIYNFSDWTIQYNDDLAQYRLIQPNIHMIPKTIESLS